MPLVLRQTATAVAPRITASFLGSGGVEPYLYSVQPGGAGGSINASSGVYTAPTTAPTDPSLIFDTIEVEDYDGVTATAQIMVGSPLLLFCEIIQRELGLENGRVYLWDQKIMQPTDSGLYVAVSMPHCKPFGNVNRSTSSSDEGPLESQQYISMLAVLDIDIISRSTLALTRKEEVLLALNSDYARRQGDANSFSIGRLPAGAHFLNLSNVDGAAIPYRYRISVNMQYAYFKTAETSYFNDFEVSEEIDP
jgi:hypothetical protein